MVGLPIREQSTRDKMTGNKQLYINLKITNGKVWQRIPTSILFKKKKRGCHLYWNESIGYNKAIVHTKEGKQIIKFMLAI